MSRLCHLQGVASTTSHNANVRRTKIEADSQKEDRVCNSVKQASSSRTSAVVLHWLTAVQKKSKKDADLPPESQSQELIDFIIHRVRRWTALTIVSRCRTLSAGMVQGRWSCRILQLQFRWKLANVKQTIEEATTVLHQIQWIMFGGEHSISSVQKWSKRALSSHLKQGEGAFSHKANCRENGADHGGTAETRVCVYRTLATNEFVRHLEDSERLSNYAIPEGYTLYSVSTYVENPSIPIIRRTDVGRRHYRCILTNHFVEVPIPAVKMISPISSVRVV
ncbi:hypothetical protein KIN20_016674 [Parelaphostrongylus tenuis]|uniref:Uncharacterized protein n=1 Tax=Parelaphostrongylus tenuis TaxID=148309 RepID=A0AAD5N255_PARTN|nr:hypothetical protein KIN20_016674 [Parelaphostrongylus tenuis]